MTSPKVYIDTSVFGGAFDKEFQKASLEFFSQVQNGLFIPVISAFVRDELELAPKEVKELFENIRSIAGFVELTDSSRTLQKAYLEAGIVTNNSRVDAYHVALATASGCPLIVSWNFKHIVHYQKIPLYNGVNQTKGYSTIGIYSPLEVIK